MSAKEKLKFGFYWAASCGGCEIAVLDLNEKILDVINIADIVFWPVAMDVKYKDVESFPDDYIDVCFFNGSVRNSEQKDLANLLRKKSKILVAFGSCAQHGCIPGLANLHNRHTIFQTIYQETLSTNNPLNKSPQTNFKSKEGELTLPEFYDKVTPLKEVVEVDYYLPGCPPPVPLIINAVEQIAQGTLPKKGTVLAPVKTLCEECARNTNQPKKMPDIKRTYEIQADPNLCFLEQGIICLGPVTRAGCQTRCINGNWPCTGCLGPTPEVVDQGAKMMSAIGSILKIDEEKELSEAEIEKLASKIKDPIGTFYMYGFATAILNKKAK